MAEPSLQDTQAQVRQAQQNATAPQQPPPLLGANGGAYPPPPVLPQSAVGGGYALPPLPPIPPHGLTSLANVAPKGITVNLGKISLLAVCFSLMFFGIFTFLSGLLLGMWFAGPEPISFAAEKKETSILGLIPREQQTSDQTSSDSSQMNGFSSFLKEKAGPATEELISHVPIPGVPHFLKPLISETQSAAGKQLGYKAQQQVQRQSTHSMSSSPQPQTGQPINTPTPLPSQQPLSSGVPCVPSSYPVVTPQKALPSTPTSHADTRSLSPRENEGYTIQLGVFAAKDNADALVNHMQALNHTSHIVEGKAPDGSALYYVHSGLYNDYNVALDTASQFASQNIPGAIVVKISKDKGTS